MKKWRSILFGSAMVIAFLVSPMIAQQEQGSIRGLVTDQTGAVVPNAAMTLRNQGTSQIRTTTSGSDGTYVFTPLPIGTYQVTAEANGFKTEIRSDLSCTSRRNWTLISASRLDRRARR